jgi:hypothetical protein
MEEEEGAESAARMMCAIRCTGRRGTTLSMKARKKKGQEEEKGTTKITCDARL